MVSAGPDTAHGPKPKLERLRNIARRQRKAQTQPSKTEEFAEGFEDNQPTHSCVRCDAHFRMRIGKSFIDNKNAASAVHSLSQFKQRFPWRQFAHPDCSD